MEIIGEFNDWKSKIKLIKCKLRQGIYVKYFDDGLATGEYEFKFIINGSFQVSSMYEIIQNDLYGYLNILEIKNNRPLHNINSYSSI